MLTKLDERDELIMLIDRLNYNDLHKLSIFLAGLEAGKKENRVEHSEEQKTVFQ